MWEPGVDRAPSGKNAAAHQAVMERMRPASNAIFSTAELTVSLIETAVLCLEMIFSVQRRCSLYRRPSYAQNRQRTLKLIGSLP
jgi:hypothetical protein